MRYRVTDHDSSYVVYHVISQRHTNITPDEIVNDTGKTKNKRLALHLRNLLVFNILLNIKLKSKYFFFFIIFF